MQRETLSKIEKSKNRLFQLFNGNKNDCSTNKHSNKNNKHTINFRKNKTYIKIQCECSQFSINIQLTLGKLNSY